MRSVCLSMGPFALIALSGVEKKCLDDDIGTDEDDMAITCHDDLRFVQDVVRMCDLYIYNSQ